MDNIITCLDKTNFTISLDYVLILRTKDRITNICTGKNLHTSQLPIITNISEELQLPQLTIKQLVSFIQLSPT